MAVVDAVSGEEPSEDAVPSAPEVEEVVAISGQEAPAEEGNEVGNVDVVPTEDDQVAVVSSSEPCLREMEDAAIGAELLFGQDPSPRLSGWDNLRWMSMSGTRKVRLCQTVYRREESEQKQLFWSTTETAFRRRTLILYDAPNLVVLARAPNSADEVREFLGLPDVADLEDAEAALDAYMIVESVIDPAVAKLRLSSLTNPSSLFMGEKASARDRSCIQLMAPMEAITLSAVQVRDEQSFVDSAAFLETTAIEHALVRSITAAHASDDEGAVLSDQTWKHQVILGSLHSLALHGSEKILGSVLQSLAARVDEEGVPLAAKLIDAPDESGRPPIYYACRHRMSSAVSSLVRAGARIDFRDHENGMTLCHISASVLDDVSLSTILAATNPSRVDPNAMDARGQTPMYIATTEGAGPAALDSAVAIGRCVAALEAWGGQLVIDGLAVLPHPIRIAAARWQDQKLSALLSSHQFHSPFTRRCDEAEDQSGESCGMSLGAQYQYPVHAALIAFHVRITSLHTMDESVSDFSLIRVLKVLLERGFEPNERLDMLREPVFPDFVGFAPLQIVSLTALCLEKLREDTSVTVHLQLSTFVKAVCHFLIQCGARISLESPPLSRPRRQATGSEEASCRPLAGVERSSLRIDSSKELMDLLGGENRLRESKTVWDNKKPAPTSESLHICTDDKSVIPDAFVPGGSDDKSCAICWRVFGKLTNRKHRCRVLWSYVCDDCSSKRVREGSKDHRISDGQFNLAVVESGRAESARLDEVRETDRIASLRSTRDRERAQAESERNDRDSLFGVVEQAANYVFGDETESTHSVAGLASSMNETRNALIERGEKLSNIEDKTARMVDASSDFANMAKELRKKSEAGFFGGW